MLTTEQVNEFIDSSHHALDHLFSALDEYHHALDVSQKTVEENEHSKKMLSNLFMYRDQWSSNANHHYAQYVKRMEHLNTQQEGAMNDQNQRLQNALLSIGATVESMSSLAGAVLQIAKQALSLKYDGKPDSNGARKISSQCIVEVIWEGRNHAMHWDDLTPKPKMKNMLDLLASDLEITIEIGKNNSLSILGALGWRTTNDVVQDLRGLI